MSVNLGMISIWLSLVFGLGATVYSIISYFNRDETAKQISQKLEIACAGAITFAIVLMTYYLLNVNAAYTKYLVNTKLMGMTRSISLLIASVFLLLLVLKNPFAVYYAIPGGMLELTNWDAFVVPYEIPYGQGMNPLLRNPWMAIHPPVLFLGYAAFTYLDGEHGTGPGILLKPHRSFHGSQQRHTCMPKHEQVMENTNSLHQCLQWSHSYLSYLQHL
jgi:cytochrome c-type biogenesis protein CcmF